MYACRNTDVVLPIDIQMFYFFFNFGDIIYCAIGNRMFKFHFK